MCARLSAITRPIARQDACPAGARVMLTPGSAAGGASSGAERSEATPECGDLGREEPVVRRRARASVAGWRRKTASNRSPSMVVETTVVRQRERHGREPPTANGRLFSDHRIPVELPWSASQSGRDRGARGDAGRHGAWSGGSRHAAADTSGAIRTPGRIVDRCALAALPHPYTVRAKPRIARRVRLEQGADSGIERFGANSTSRGIPTPSPAKACSRASLRAISSNEPGTRTSSG